MKKYFVLLLLGIFAISCSQKGEPDNNPVIQESDSEVVEKEKSFSELFSTIKNGSFFIIWFMDENDSKLSQGFYKIYSAGETKYGIGADYIRLALIQDIYTDDSITLYFSYLRSNGTQIDSPPYYRVVVTKDEVEQVIDNVNSGKEKYYSIDKVREFLGNELPKELEGVELPWE